MPPQIPEQGEDNDDAVKRELEDAMLAAHPEDGPTEDPFSKDGLGNEPAEEDDSGRV